MVPAFRRGGLPFYTFARWTEHTLPKSAAESLDLIENKGLGKRARKDTTLARAPNRERIMLEIEA